MACLEAISRPRCDLYVHATRYFSFLGIFSGKYCITSRAVEVKLSIFSLKKLSFKEVWLIERLDILKDARRQPNKFYKLKHCEGYFGGIFWQTCVVAVNSGFHHLSKMLFDFKFDESEASEVLSFKIFI